MDWSLFENFFGEKKRGTNFVLVIKITYLVNISRKNSYKIETFH